MPLPASWCTLRCDSAYVEGGRLGMYLSPMCVFAKRLHPYFLLINTPPLPPEADSGALSEPVLRWCCGGAASVLMSVSRGRCRKNDALGSPMTPLRIQHVKMCVSPQRERHFASTPSLFLRKTAILTRGENGDFAWEVCTFHFFMSFF